MSTLTRSRLAENLDRLSALYGSFYFYEPRERPRSGEPGSPLVWESVSPDIAESLSYGELDSYSCALCSSLTGSLGLTPEEAISRISERRLWRKVSLLFVPSHCESGDYGGSVYALSNAEALLKEFGGSPGCRELIGGHGSYGLAIDVRYVSEDLLEALESLESYPLYDEEHCCLVEDRLKEEAFSSYLERDLRRLLEETAGEALRERGLSEEEAEEEAERRAESLTEGDLWELLSSADSDGCLWEQEHNSMYCALDRIHPSCLLEALSL
jgi:hypothetical protein